MQRYGTRGFSTVAYAWQTFLKRHESVGQNEAKRRMIRPKRFKNNFPNAAVGNARLFNRGLCLGKLS